MTGEGGTRSWSEVLLTREGAAHMALQRGPSAVGSARDAGRRAASAAERAAYGCKARRIRAKERCARRPRCS